MNEDNDELPPSVLGTKEYWNSAYQVEIENFKNHGDVGEVWFGEESAHRIVRSMSGQNVDDVKMSVMSTYQICNHRPAERSPQQEMH